MVHPNRPTPRGVRPAATAVIRRLLFFALAVALLAGRSAPATAQDDLIAQGSFQVLRKKERTELCRSSWEIRDDGRHSRLLEAGQGSCHGFDEPVRWESETRMRSDNPRLLHSSVRRFYGPDGALLKSSSRAFDPALRLAVASVSEATSIGQARHRSWAGLEDVATPSSLLFIIPAGLANGRTKGSIKLLTSEPALYTIRWVSRGPERVTVPAGSFDCVKIELLPELGLLSPLRPLLPKLYVWYTAAAPFDWIKYEGLEDGAHSAKVVIERTSPVSPTLPQWRAPRNKAGEPASRPPTEP